MSVRRTGSSSQTLDLRSLGLAFRVSSNDSALLDEATDFLPPGWESGQSDAPEQVYELRVLGGENEGRRYELHVDGQLVESTPLRTGILWYMESDMRYFIAGNVPDRVFVHAAALGWRGRVILLPGKSDAGKSTLALALARAGADYYSDEYALLDRHGQVHPYPCPLRLRLSTGGRRFGPEQLHHALPAGDGMPPAPVGCVVFTRYAVGRRWRPRELTPGQAIVRTLQCTVATIRRPSQTMRYLKTALQDAPAIEST